MVAFDEFCRCSLFSRSYHLKRSKMGNLAVIASINLATLLKLCNSVKAATYVHVPKGHGYIICTCDCRPVILLKQHVCFSFQFPCNVRSLSSFTVGPLWSLRVHTQTPGCNLGSFRSTSLQAEGAGHGASLFSAGCPSGQDTGRWQADNP